MRCCINKLFHVKIDHQMFLVRHYIMIFKSTFHKILAILFSISVILSGFLIFFKTYPDNYVSTISDAVLYVALEFFSQIRGSVKELIKDIQTSREAQSKIDELNKEINVLREQLVDYQETKQENNRLFKYYDIKKDNPEMKFVSASVIGRMPGDSKGNFFIDAGKSKGISVNDSVITENGFIGKVFRVGDFTSNVKTIMAPDIQVGAIDHNTENSGIISGTPELADKNLTRMILMKYKDSVNISDILVTSGLSGIYPKDIKIGKVESIDYDYSNSYYYATVRPFDELDDIKNVFIITDFSQKSIIDY